jgi:hypothetical protein
VLASILERFGDDLVGHTRRDAPAVHRDLVAELLNIDGDEAVVDERHRAKQPDWSYDAEWSGKVPADVMADRRGPDADDY